MRDPAPYAPPRAAPADPAPAGPAPARPSPLLRRWFRRSFWLCLLFGGFAVALLGSAQALAMFAPTFLALFAAVVLHLYCLGLAASRVGRSALLWVGGALLFAPLGTLIAFVRMSALLTADDKAAGKATAE